MQKYLLRLQFKSEMITLLSISVKIIIIFTYTKVWKSNVNDDEDDEDILLPKLIEGCYILTSQKIAMIITLCDCKADFSPEK